MAIYWDIFCLMTLGLANLGKLIHIQPPSGGIMKLHYTD